LPTCRAATRRRRTPPRNQRGASSRRGGGARHQLGIICGGSGAACMAVVGVAVSEAPSQQTQCCTADTRCRQDHAQQPQQPPRAPRPGLLHCSRLRLLPLLLPVLLLPVLLRIGPWRLLRHCFLRLPTPPWRRRPPRQPERPPGVAVQNWLAKLCLWRGAAGTGGRHGWLAAKQLLLHVWCANPPQIHDCENVDITQSSNARPIYNRHACSHPSLVVYES
jgi:hypothetical protein